MKEELLAKIEALQKEAVQVLSSFQSIKELQDYKIHVLGKKGLLTEVLKGLGGLSPEERPLVGQRANEVKQTIESQLILLQKSLEGKEKEAKFRSQKIDATLPGLQFGKGFRHPLSLVQKEIEQIFLNLGFSIHEGPDCESDYYNFGALNFPPDHPAREMQDTFYIKSEIRNPKSELLLRTHTSPVQIRVMEKQKPPLYIIAPGAVYRHDHDVTHSPMFHQVEGLMVDTNITFGDLKGVLTLFCRTIFGADRKVRFRPSFFPFVEPGAEVDISCALCNGKGCRVCGGDGWLEILGAGMVHPAV